MLIDFCHHSVRPKIKSDKVSFDGFEVTNLISEDDRVKTKGFISDHFVKPPVNVTVQFPCNISIYRIVIDPVIGQQQSCDIKLFTASCSGLDPWLIGEQGSKKERELKTDGVLFNFIGSSSQATPVPTCYQNTSFRDRGFWNRENCENVSSFPAHFELRGRKPCCLFNVSHLSVNILRSKGGKTVAIKRLEVWGMPSRNVPDAAQLMLRLAYQRSIGAAPSANSKENVTTTKRDNSSIPQNNSASDNVLYGDVEVPDDFVDQITFEIMAVPILLPCGKNVDQSTLERFVNTEASWGRHPSDPFTGVPFSQGHGAVPNPALKARIDKFVLQHSKTLNVPRTLGKGDHSTSGNFASSKITSLPPEDYGSGCDSMSQCTPKLHQNKNDMHVSISGKRKSTQPDLSDYFDEKKSFVAPVTGQMKIWKRQKTILHTTDMIQPSLLSGKDLGINSTRDISEYMQDRPPTHTAALDHSRSLSNSLDSALLSTLTALPSFTKSLKHKEDKGSNSEKGCNPPVMNNTCCNCSKEPETVVYKLPCQHVICRLCIQKSDGLIDCSRCCKQFYSRDIVRVFRT